MPGQLGKGTRERLAAAIYRQGEGKRAAGDAAGAAEDFLRVAQLTPKSRVVPTARYDAATARASWSEEVRRIAGTEPDSGEALEAYLDRWLGEEESARAQAAIAATL